MMISLGYNCFTALGLRNINHFQPSLPFDFLGNMNNNSLMSVYNILQSLKDKKFNIDDFVTIDSHHKNNLNFWLGHFCKDNKKWMEDSENQKSLKDLFQKRFNRLQNNFFTQPNLVFYSRNRTFEVDESIKEAAKLILSLNPENYLIVLGNHESFNLSKNIEFLRHKRRSSKSIKYHIKLYISLLSPETKKYYEQFTSDV